MAFALFIPSYLHICRVTERREYAEAVIWPYSTQGTLSHMSPLLHERRVEENTRDQGKGSLRSCWRPGSIIFSTNLKNLEETPKTKAALLYFMFTHSLLLVRFHQDAKYLGKLGRPSWNISYCCSVIFPPTSCLFCIADIPPLFLAYMPLVSWRGCPKASDIMKTSEMRQQKHNTGSVTDWSWSLAGILKHWFTKTRWHLLVLLPP